MHGRRRRRTSVALDDLLDALDEGDTVGGEVARERVQKALLLGIAGQIAQRRYPYGNA